MRTPSSQKCRLDLAPPWADRFILGITPSITARHFSAGPSDSTSRWTPCPPKYSKRRLQVGLGCVQLSPSCPVRRLHTFRFLRPARLRTPLLGYGAPHLSARGTSTLLNNALLSAHFHGVRHGCAVDLPGLHKQRSRLFEAIEPPTIKRPRKGKTSIRKFVFFGKFAKPRGSHSQENQD